MKKLIVAFLLSGAFFITPAQDQHARINTELMAEGKLLYRSEMASWYGTDIFLERHADKETIGGYFSYVQGDTAKCVFFSRGESPVVIGTIAFDSTYAVNKASADLAERPFTGYEKEIYTIRQAALKAIGEDSMFKQYTNTQYNVIPLIEGKSKKIYVLTGPQKQGVVIFGNDYLITFNDKNEIISKKKLHQNIIAIEYAKGAKDKTETGSYHSHLPETGALMTATDICTLMLYGKFTDWESHSVVSKDYYSIWYINQNTLVTIPKKVMDKMNKSRPKGR